MDNKILKNTAICFFISGMFFLQNISAQKLEFLKSGITASFRGLSALNDTCVWVSGTMGAVGRTVDGGKTWYFTRVRGFENFDFRDIECFSDSVAVIASAGSPAYIFKTVDAGKTWKQVYKNEQKEIFIDGFCFWNANRGIAFGDPMEGRFFLLETYNGGESWKPFSIHDKPVAVAGESAFAASGSSIQCADTGKVFIGTGGSVSRILYSKDYGHSWNFWNTPMKHGSDSKGIFSIALNKYGNIYIAGGDYKADSLNDSTTFFTSNGGTRWESSYIPATGYRSCVDFIDEKRMISCGTNGVDVSDDKGIKWEKISGESFNVCKKAKYGKYIFLAGGKGKIAKYWKSRL